MGSQNTVTRAGLAEAIYRELGYSKAEASDMVDKVIDEIINALVEEGEMKISLFGTFRVSEKKERMGRNPKTLEEVPVSARKVVNFYVSNLLKKRVNDKK